MRYAHINTTDKALLYETWVNGMYFSKREQYFESVGRDYKLDEKIMPMPGQKVVKFYNEDFLDQNQIVGAPKFEFGLKIRFGTRQNIFLTAQVSFDREKFDFWRPKLVLVQKKFDF